LSTKDNIPLPGNVNRKVNSLALSLADRLYFMTKEKVVYSDTRYNLEGKQEVFVKYLGVEV
jgi:ABC-type branched-subunit amino acid transport system ATPase component